MSTHERCKAPAMKGKTKCATHGGKSSGPKSAAGKARCAQARTTHGQQTTRMRIERSLASVRLAILEEVGHGLKMRSGPRTPGRRPDRMGEAIVVMFDNSLYCWRNSQHGCATDHLL